ncbi:MAG: biotin/lipoyl-containing protein [Bacteroidota bacterium]
MLFEYTDKRRITEILLQNFFKYSVIFGNFKNYAEIPTLKTNTMSNTYTISAEFIPEAIEAVIINDLATIGSEAFSFRRDTQNPFVIYAQQNGEEIPLVCRADEKGNVSISLRGYTYLLKTASEKEAFYQHLLKTTSQVKISAAKVPAPMPGLIKGISVKNGQNVKKGENLFILEAMKMENIIKSPMAGIVKNLTIQEGNAVEKNAILCVIDAE